MSYLDVLTTAARAAIADDALFDLTGDAEWRFDIAPDDWTPASISRILDRWLTTGNFRSWRIQLETTGDISLGLENGSGAFRVFLNLDWTPPADGTRVQIRIQLDADDGSGNMEAYFYTRTGADIQDLESDDDWTLQEHNTDNPPAQTWKASTSSIALASNSEGAAGSGLIGRYYRAVMWKDLTKTTKCFDVDFTDGDNRVGGDNAVWSDGASTNDWNIAGTENTAWAWVLEVEGTGTSTLAGVTSAGSGTIPHDSDGRAVLRSPQKSSGRRR